MKLSKRLNDAEKLVAIKIIASGKVSTRAEDQIAVKKLTEMGLLVGSEERVEYSEDIKKVFNYWNLTEGLPEHTKLRPKYATAIRKAEKSYDHEEICSAIATYANILASPSCYVFVTPTNKWDVKWTLDEFLGRKDKKGQPYFQRFTDDNYDIKKHCVPSKTNQRKRLLENE